MLALALGASKWRAGQHRERRVQHPADLSSFMSWREYSKTETMRCWNSPPCTGGVLVCRKGISDLQDGVSHPRGKENICFVYLFCFIVARLFA